MLQCTKIQAPKPVINYYPLYSTYTILNFSLTPLTGRADSECCQGPAESQHASVLGAESVQAVLHQLAQRLGQALQALLQLRHRRTGDTTIIVTIHTSSCSCSYPKDICLYLSLLPLQNMMMFGVRHPAVVFEFKIRALGIYYINEPSQKKGKI